MIVEGKSTILFTVRHRKIAKNTAPVKLLKLAIVSWKYILHHYEWWRCFPWLIRCSSTWSVILDFYLLFCNNLCHKRLWSNQSPTLLTLDLSPTWKGKISAFLITLKWQKKENFLLTNWVFHNKMSMNSLNLMTKNSVKSKGLAPRITSV